MELQKLIDRIMWGKSIVDVSDENGNSQNFILRSLTIREQNFSDHIYDKYYREAINDGVLTLDQLKQLYAEDGTWTEEDDHRIKGLDIQIKKAKSAILQNEFSTIRKKKFKKKLSEFERSMLEMLSDRDALFSLSAEQRAEEMCRRFVVMMSTENMDERNYWEGIDDFLEETDTVLIFNLAIAYYKNNIFDQETIRRVARSPDWQFRFRASKSGADIFGKPVPEWSEMQNLLMYWSQIYDSVFNAYERPGDHIIEDDDALDSWMEAQSKKNSLGTSSDTSRNTAGNKLASKQMNHQEQFVVVDKGDKEAIEKIQSMNDDATRFRLQMESNKMKDGGRVSEFNLRKQKIISDAKKST